MHPRNGRVLHAQPGIGIPATVEQYQQRLDAVPGGDGQEGVDAFLEARGILLATACRARRHAWWSCPWPAPQPNSLSIWAGSKLASCHISSWLMALAGIIIAAHQPFLLAVPGHWPAPLSSGRALPPANSETAPARRRAKAASSSSPLNSYPGFLLWNARIFARMRAADGGFQLGVELAGNPGSPSPLRHL